MHKIPFVNDAAWAGTKPNDSSIYTQTKLKIPWKQTAEHQAGEEKSAESMAQGRAECNFHWNQNEAFLSQVFLLYSLLYAWGFFKGRTQSIALPDLNAKSGGQTPVIQRSHASNILNWK